MSVSRIGLLGSLALLWVLAGVGTAVALTLDDGGSHSITGDHSAEELRITDATEAFLEPGSKVATGFLKFPFPVTILGGSRVVIRGGELGGAGLWVFMDEGTELLMTSGVLDHRGETKFDAGAGSTLRLEGGTWHRTDNTDFVNAGVFEVLAEVDVPPVEKANLALANLERATVRAGAWDLVTLQGLPDAEWSADAQDILVKDDGPVVFDGGEIVDLEIRADGSALVEGGVIDELRCSLGGSATVEAGELALIVAEGKGGGGFVAGTVEIRGGDIGEIMAFDSASVEVHGLAFDAPNGPVSELAGALTGTLLDGSTLDAAFTRDATASIVVVPEPRGALLSAASLALLHALARGKRRLARGAAGS